MAGKLKYFLARRFRKWKPVTGIVLDSRVKKRWRRQHDPVDGGLPQHEYVIEISEDGQDTYRLMVEEPWGPGVDFDPPKIGATVALLVNDERTEAVFDQGHPSMTTDKERERGVKDREKSEDQAWKQKWSDKTRNERD